MTIKVNILPETTKYPITLMGRRAGYCTNSDTTDDDKNFERGLSCLRSDHGRVLEYVQVDLEISGVSSRVIREWYTHIGGSPTRLQVSTRYVDYGKHVPVIVPPSISSKASIMTRFYEYMDDLSSFIEYLKDRDVPLEDIAMFYPLGTETKIVDHRNLRNLIEMSHQRLCTRAYWEYRELFKIIKSELSKYSEEWEMITDYYFLRNCEYLGWCPEDKSCYYIETLMKDE